MPGGINFGGEDISAITFGGDDIGEVTMDGQKIWPEKVTLADFETDGQGFTDESGFSRISDTTLGGSFCLEVSATYAWNGASLGSGIENGWEYIWRMYPQVETSAINFMFASQDPSGAENDDGYWLQAQAGSSHLNLFEKTNDESTRIEAYSGNAGDWSPNTEYLVGMRFWPNGDVQGVAYNADGSLKGTTDRYQNTTYRGGGYAVGIGDSGPVLFDDLVKRPLP